MSHSFFLSSIILIISGGRYNLWSYTLCSFLQYPITFGHKVKGLISTVPKPSLQYFLNVTDQVSHPQIWKYYVNNFCISTVKLSESRKENKTLQCCSSKHCSKLISSPFLYSAIYIYSLMPLKNTSSFPTFQTMYQVGHVIFMVWYPHWDSRIHNETDMWLSIHNFAAVIMLATCFSYKVTIIRLFMWEVQKEIIQAYLWFTYG